MSAPYDRRAAAYDAVVGRSIYHRVFWGTSRRAFEAFGREALDAAGNGSFAEVGCGSLLFTAALHRDGRRARVALIDRSSRMLERARARLGSTAADSHRLVMVHADAERLPVAGRTFSSILCLNMLHVPCDRMAVAAECRRALIPGRGRLFVSALVHSGRWSDAYLSLLYRAGELGPPLIVEELQRLVAGHDAIVESTRVEGNMCFLVVRHAVGS